MAVMTVWAAVLITYGVFAGTAMDSASAVYQLDMAPNSVDDMYDGCIDDMKSKVESDFLPKEKNTNEKFKQAWNNASEKYDLELRRDEASVNNNLGTGIRGKEQVMAIVVYTQEEGQIYSDLNKMVRNQSSLYNTTFGYHALHFYLTDAIQTLRDHSGKKCYSVHRGTPSSFSQDVLNKEIRFGSFTSSTTAGYEVALRFGNKSCFEIETCHGANISVHSIFKSEAEVLIPPYEVFKVTKIIKKSENKEAKCDVVYTVKSTRTLSNLNCALF